MTPRSKIFSIFCNKQWQSSFGSKWPIRDLGKKSTLISLIPGHWTSDHVTCDMTRSRDRSTMHCDMGIPNTLWHVTNIPYDNTLIRWWKYPVCDNTFEGLKQMHPQKNELQSQILIVMQIFFSCQNLPVWFGFISGTSVSLH